MHIFQMLRENAGVTVIIIGVLLLDVAAVWLFLVK
jgi:hypothetical protein